jgi:hypothetical protein
MMRNATRNLLFFVCLLNGLSATGQITLDNVFSDWDDVELLTSTNDEEGWLVFGATHNDDWLFVRLGLVNPVALDETILDHDTHLLIDVDDNPATGVNYGNHGLGVDILVNFPDRQVIRYTGGTGVESLNDIGMHVAPTYSSKDFELAIRRTDADLADSDGCRLMVVDNGVGAAFPTGGLAVDLTPAVVPAFETPLERHPAGLIRVAFWNVNGRFGQANPEAAMASLLALADPDVIGFSEVSNASATSVRNKLNTWLPLPDGAEWNVVKDDWDLMVASRFPILETHASVNRQFPVLIETTDVVGSPTLFTSSHLKCCGGQSNEDQRQAEADAFMGFLRDGMESGDWPEPLPVIYGGDLNMVGLVGPVTTLTTGNIEDEGSFGPDFAPDADGTHFTEWPIVQSDHPMDYTWENNNGEWIPGKLDYIITSDAVLEMVRGYGLNTGTMSAARLAEFGLSAGTTLTASDHTMIVADFAGGPMASGPSDLDGDGIFDSADNCPTIANPTQSDFNGNGIGDSCEDSDGDGLSDALEIHTYGSSPDAVDTDGNGIQDGLELCPCNTSPACVGDFNGDAVISVADLLMLLGIFGQNC